MVQLGGLEPPTSGSTIRRSNQLSYNCTKGAEIRGRAPQKQAGLKRRRVPVYSGRSVQGYRPKAPVCRARDHGTTACISEIAQMM